MLRMPKLTARREGSQVRGSDREVGMMTIMWASTERGVAVQRKRYKQVAITLHGDRHAGCALYSG